MDVPDVLHYTETDEWARRDGARVTVGITDYAQRHLGDITFVELPRVGTRLQRGQPLATVESVKAASEVYTPVSGTVVEVNGNLIADPGLINRAPYTDGWFAVLELSRPEEFDALMDASTYAVHRSE